MQASAQVSELGSLQALQQALAQDQDLLPEPDQQVPASEPDLLALVLASELDLLGLALASEPDLLGLALASDLLALVSGLPELDRQASGLPGLGLQASGLPGLDRQASDLPELGLRVSDQVCLENK